jgi:DNA-binding CsgD family transcriptional regulator
MDGLLDCDSVLEMSKVFVTSDYVDQTCTGAVFAFFQDDNGLEFQGKFGINCEKLEARALELFESGVLYSMSSQSIHVERASEFSIGFAPVTHSGDKLGFAILYFSTQVGPEIVFISDLVAPLSRLMGLKVNSFKQSQKLTDQSLVHTQPLSQRQSRILQLISEDLTNAEIASILFVSQSTVRHETIRIFESLQAPSRKHAVEIAIASGILAQNPG